MTRPVAIRWTLLFLLAFVVVVLYWPGLSGPFLLDDYSNLNGLALIQEFGWPDGVMHFLATNNSGTLGRPVSLISFLLDGQNWPTDPLPFKRTNILIHAANTTLVFVFALLVARRSLSNSTYGPTVAGFLAALIWAVHPLQVSTVLYVVQRMAMLSALFGLAAIICLVRGREVVESSGRGMGWLFGFMLLVTLSVLSKENGALVFPIAWFVEALVFRASTATLPNWYRIWRRLFLMAPSLLLLAYLLSKWPAAAIAYEIRDFTLCERLLTQPRVLGFYLYNIFVPSSVAATLYYDSFEVSKGLFAPPSTAISIGCLIAAITFIWKGAARWPLISLATGWFLLGHSMEASFIPLELVFEHRNYFPLIGISVVAGILAVRVFTSSTEIWKRLGLGVMLLYVLGMTIPWTYQAVNNWSDEARLIYTWAFYDESSIRAQSDFAQLVAVQGQPREAIEILEALAEHHPNELTVRMRLASFSCEYTGSVPDSVWEGFDAESHRLFSAGAISAAQRYLRSASQNQCAEINTDSVVELFDTLLIDNEQVLRVQARAVLHYMLGNYLVGQGAVQQGFFHLDRASVLQPTVDVPLRQASLMFSLGNLSEARKYIAIARERNENRVRGLPSREQELINFLSQINSASDEGRE